MSLARRNFLSLYVSDRGFRVLCARIRSTALSEVGFAVVWTRVVRLSLNGVIRLPVECWNPFDGIGRRPIRCAGRLPWVA